MRKRIISTLLCMCVIIGMIGMLSASAVSESVATESFQTETMLRWENVVSITLNMSRSNNKVTSETVITGKAGTTKISASYTLERLVNGRYEIVDSWTASSNTMILSNSHDTINCPAGSYRLSVTATVIRNGTPEVVSDSLIKNFA